MLYRGAPDWAAPAAGTSPFDEVQDYGNPQETGHQNDYARSQRQYGEDQEKLEAEGNILAGLGLTYRNIQKGYYRQILRDGTRCRCGASGKITGTRLGIGDGNIPGTVSRRRKRSPEAWAYKASGEERKHQQQQQLSHFPSREPEAIQWHCRSCPGPHIFLSLSRCLTRKSTLPDTDACSWPFGKQAPQGCNKILPGAVGEAAARRVKASINSLSSNSETTETAVSAEASNQARSPTRNYMECFPTARGEEASTLM
jgi:hypothetical protein